MLRVPRLAELALPAALGRFLQALRRASAAATRQRLPPLLRLRAMLAYGVSCATICCEAPWYLVVAW